MSKLFIPVGVPGCGKSTLTGNLLDAVHVSSDAIRNRMGVGQDRNDEVFERYHQDIEDDLLKGYDVVADATNLRDFARAKLYAIAERCNAEVHVLFFTNVSQAIRRNAQRPVDGGPGNEPVPFDVMQRMLLQWEDARAVIDAEPHDTLTRIDGVN
jgi:predicted kinase